MAMGQAAGLAAAMAVKGGSTPSRVDGSELHAELVKRGAAFLRRVVYAGGADNSHGERGSVATGGRRKLRPRRLPVQKVTMGTAKKLR